MNEEYQKHPALQPGTLPSLKGAVFIQVCFDSPEQGGCVGSSEEVGHEGCSSSRLERSKSIEKFAFPTPSHVPDGYPGSFVAKVRILKLFSKNTGVNQQRFTTKVKEWFANEAHRVGWAAAIELGARQAGVEEGILLLAPGCQLRVKPRIQVAEDVLTPEQPFACKFSLRGPNGTH